MIVNFKNRETSLVFAARKSRRLPLEIQPKATKLLAILDEVIDLDEIARVPGNRFHALDKDRKGQYSVAINMQWRICFGWSDGGATDVEICDYH